MAGPCCMGGPASRRLARRLSGAAASALPGALLVFLPKCPLCLAAWLTIATGLSFTAAGAAWVRAIVLLSAAAAAALDVKPLIRLLRRGYSMMAPCRIPAPMASARLPAPNFPSRAET